MNESRKDFITMVARFMKKYGQTMRRYPQIPEGEPTQWITDLTRYNSGDYVSKEELLRWKLISEEATETCAAIASRDLVGIADGLADLLYVTFGTALTYGIPIETIFCEVHRSNMTKTKLGHTEAGEKIQKGAYEPAQVEKLINNMIALGKQDGK